MLFIFFQPKLASHCMYSRCFIVRINRLQNVLWFRAYYTIIFVTIHEVKIIRTIIAQTAGDSVPHKLCWIVKHRCFYRHRYNLRIRRHYRIFNEKFNRIRYTPDNLSLNGQFTRLSVRIFIWIAIRCFKQTIKTLELKAKDKKCFRVEYFKSCRKI